MSNLIIFGFLEGFFKKLYLYSMNVAVRDRYKNLILENKKRLWQYDSTIMLER